MESPEGMQTAPTQTEDAPQTEAPQVNDALMARLDQMSQQIGELRQTPSAEPAWEGGISDLAYQQPAEQFDPNGFDPNQGFDPSQQQFDPNQQYDPNGYQPGQYAPQQYQDPQQAQAQAMQQLNAYIAEQVKAGVQPFIQQQQQQVTAQKLDALEKQYPALADKETAGKTVQEAVRLAQRMGRPDLPHTPEFLELVHLAQSARDRAAQETPATGEQGVHIEQGGAAPQQPEQDAGDRILSAWGFDPSSIG